MASTAASAELIHVRAMEKEENRLNMKRAQNKARLQRFLDARTRTIGLDVGALNAQMEQRKKMKELEKEADRLEAQRNELNAKGSVLISGSRCTSMCMHCLARSAGAEGGENRCFKRGFVVVPTSLGRVLT